MLIRGIYCEGDPTLDPESAARAVLKVLSE
jgi:hypothetical protein